MPALKLHMAAQILLAVPALAASCESLASLALPDTTITLAQTIAPGEFAPPATAAKGKQGAAFRDLPGFCRVTATLKPSADSDIRIEVWMPASNWNEKFEANGNGGWTGSINSGTLAAGLRRGYAAAMTDTGHEGGSGSFALGHPEKLVDFGYRAVHEMAVKSKALIAAYYGKAPRLSYWNGCSSGGKQGLKEAQRFPDDFDGIIAGAPANYWTHLTTQGIWVLQAVNKEEGSNLPADKTRLLHQAVLAACDALDGVKDGVVDDPTRCKFDPKSLECKAAGGPDCLTAPQVQAARQVYGAVKNPRTKQELFPGFEPGSELGWPQTFSAVAGLAADHFKYVVFRDPNWDYKTLNFDSDIVRADQVDSGLINATDPNLKPFFGHGGKLLQYHGWADPLIPPGNSINYYKSVADAMGGTKKIQDSYRLFMAPGVAHCAGGDGPNTFDMVSAIEQWVEKGKAPDQIIASHITSGSVDRTRPLCPYPQVAAYKGAGSTDDAANFTCKAK